MRRKGPCPRRFRRSRRGTNLTLGQFRALLALDQLARGLGDALLVDYLTGGAQSQSLETNAWQSAHALSRSFGQAFECALRQIRDREPSRGWREHLTTVLLRLFQHRQVEFLLRPFTSEHSDLDGWAGLHGAYRFAESIGARLHPLVSRRCHEECGEASTLEREYIHVLLLQWMNGGHLSPYEAFWLNRKIPRWCAVLSLQAEPALGVADSADPRFVVDLDSAAGLAWPSRSPAGTPSVSRSCADAGVDPRRDCGVERSCPSRGTRVAAAAWPTAQAVGHDRHELPAQGRADRSPRRAPARRVDRRSRRRSRRRSPGCCGTRGERRTPPRHGRRPGSMPARTR